MNELLPILRQESAPFQLCSICPEPGHCCRNILLSINGEPLVVWEDNWKEDAQAHTDIRNLPFFKAREIAMRHQDKDGKTFVAVFYDCTNLLPDGRCGIYDTRPELCRSYLPGVDGNCCLTPEV